MERQFAQLTDWTRTPVSISALAAKHLTVEFDKMVQRWRRNHCNILSSASNKRRPTWVKKGRKTTGLHLFSQSFLQESRRHGQEGTLQDAQVAWAALSGEEKLVWKSRAKSKRHSASLVQREQRDPRTKWQDQAGEGPWNMCSRFGYPMAHSVVEEACNRPHAVLSQSASWKEVGVLSRSSR